VVAASFDGSLLRSGDAGLTFRRVAPKAGVDTLTGLVLDPSGREVMLSRQGPVR
jgi:hypothetical protein